MSELPKTFDPAAIEQRWYEHWESNGLFRPERRHAQPWTIAMPPPNVTGSLHIGHALDVTTQDILTRRERMLGKDALWIAGMDHAGIATQMVVERNLESQGVRRVDMGREAFIEHVWEWKAQSGGSITRQLRRLGASCDWANEHFTMDEGFSRAVLKVFVQLYREGLLYRDKRLVNWDPRFQSAISDLEVETREVQGKFWHLKYPLADGSGHISVATTRPETMLADMAVAVHPQDERYAKLVGSQVRLPVTGRLIPIIADEHADPELGSGAVKITPGHDFNDFEVGKRAGIRAADMLNMLDAEARVTQAADGLIPQQLVGIDRFDARTRVVEMLEAEGALERVEDRTIQLPYGDRSGVVIEPWLTDQWYVDAATLAKPAIEAVRSGKIEIVPRTWEKTWFNWLENIQPWCVSRQLWWGHRIPAWYGPGLRDDGSLIIGHVIRVDANFRETGRQPIKQEVFVAETEEEALAKAREFYPAGTTIRFSDDPSDRGESDANTAVLHRDEDVLDTWFSSALWPFATLGWPEQTEELKRHYPNDVLISGFDIIFFWDARMAMQGIHFMGRSGELPLEESVPWRRLYLHGLVRDAAGQKMSKSKGNTVDPLGLIDKYGADALRFTLAALESQGRDIKLDEKRVEGYRNFATKLWNAARFLQMNGVGASDCIAAPEAQLPVNRWIIGEVVATLGKLDRAFDDLRYDGMADAIYHFTWGTFCDWYVELVKPILQRGVELTTDQEPDFARETKTVAAWVFDQILVMLHPLMPYITEELWAAMGERPYELIVAKWPQPEVQYDYAEDRHEAEFAIGLITKIRSARTELNVPPSAKLKMTVTQLNGTLYDETYWFWPAIERLGRIDFTLITDVPHYAGQTKVESVDREIEREHARKGIQIEMPGFLGILELEGVIDLEAEKARLAKAAAAAEKQRDDLDARLSNPHFTERAKPEAVEKARADQAEKAAEAERYRAALERLG